MIMLKVTHREKAPSNKTPALTKSMNLSIWVDGTSNQNFEVFQPKQNFQKNKAVTGKTLFPVINTFCTPHSICLKHWLLIGQFCMEMLRFQS